MIRFVWISTVFLTAGILIIVLNLLSIINIGMYYGIGLAGLSFIFLLIDISQFYRYREFRRTSPLQVNELAPRIDELLKQGHSPFEITKIICAAEDLARWKINVLVHEVKRKGMDEFKNDDAGLRV